MLRAAARRLSGAAASTAPPRAVDAAGLGASLGATTATRRAVALAGSRARWFASEPHNDDWEANFEDLMAMEDSYGSGVEDLSSAAAELAGARMAEQKRLQEEMRCLRGIQPGDRVKVRVRHGAPYPEPIKRYHYNAPFGGAGLGHRPSASPIDAFDPDAEEFTFAQERLHREFVAMMEGYVEAYIAGLGRSLDDFYEAVRLQRDEESQGGSDARECVEVLFEMADITVWATGMRARARHRRLEREAPKLAPPRPRPAASPW